MKVYWHFYCSGTLVLSCLIGLFNLSSRSDRRKSRDRDGLVIGSLSAGRSLTPRARPWSRRTGKSIAPCGGSRMSTSERSRRKPTSLLVLVHHLARWLPAARLGPHRLAPDLPQRPGGGGKYLHVLRTPVLLEPVISGTNGRLHSPNLILVVSREGLHMEFRSGACAVLGYDS